MLSRCLSRAERDLDAPITARLRKAAVGRDESLDHRYDELGWVRGRLARRSTKHFSIGDKVPMHFCGQFYADLDRLVVRERLRVPERDSGSLNQGDAVHSLQRAAPAKRGRTTQPLEAISGALILLANIVMA